MKKSQYSTIIFDFGGVISSEGGLDKLAKHLAKKHGVRFDALYQTMIKHWLEARVNIKKDEAYWRAIAAVIKSSDKVARQEFINSTRIRRGMLPLIKKLGKKYRTALLSNHIVGWLGVHIKKHQLDRIFDVIIPSYDARYAKPDLNIYKITLRKLKEKPEKCIFIDDLERNLAPARELGFTTIEFKNLPKLRRQLKKLGIL